MVNPLHLVALALLAARGARWAWRRANGAPDEEEPPPRTRGNDDVALSWILFVVVAATTAVVVAPPACPAVLPAALVALEPALVAETAVRRGWPRLAFWSTRLSLLIWHRDRRGGAAMMAARATLASGHRPPAPVVTGPVTTGHVIAAALAAGGGDDARGLIAAAGWFEHQPRGLRIVWCEWNAADLAARGEWARLADAADAEVPTPRLRALRAAARRLLDRDDAPDAATFASVTRAVRHDPRWRPLLDRARAARHRPPFAPPPLPTAHAERALELHRRALLDPSWLDAAVAGWEDAPPPSEVRERILQDLDEGYAAAARLPPPGDGPIALALAERRHRTLLEAFAGQARALSARVAANRELDPLDEVRAFAWFVAHRPPAAPTGATLHGRALFRACQAALMAWGADLYNRRRQPYLFRALTRWLLAWAEEVEDLPTAETLRRNLSISAAFS